MSLLFVSADTIVTVLQCKARKPLNSIASQSNDMNVTKEVIRVLDGAQTVQELSRLALAFVSRREMNAKAKY